MNPEEADTEEADTEEADTEEADTEEADTEELDQAIRAELADMADAGIDWLNHNEPGWLERITLGRLNMANMFDCVLGQLDGTYHGYLERKDAEVDTDACGFALDPDRVISNLPAIALPFDVIYDRVEDTGYPVLTEIWKEKITGLRAPA